MSEHFNYITSNIKYRYRHSDWILNDVSISIRNGELIKVNGKNGSGKTTLFLILAGLLMPKFGKTIFNDIPMSEMSFSERSKYIGIVFQNPSYQLFGMSVREELLFGPKNQGREECECENNIKKFEEYFGKFDLHQNSSELSFGWKKILSLGCIYTMQPRILILDEPEVGLDPKNQHSLEKLVADYIKEGNSVVFSSHEDTFLSRFESKSYLIADGEIILIQ